MGGRFHLLSGSPHVATTWVRLSLLAACAAGTALLVAEQDKSRRCTEDVWTTVRDVDDSLPHNPALIEAAFERLSRAADLCSHGREDQARETLDRLRRDVGL